MQPIEGTHLLWFNKLNTTAIRKSCQQGIEMLQDYEMADRSEKGRVYQKVYRQL